MALETGSAKSLFYVAETGNRRVIDLVSQATGQGLSTEPVDAARLDELTGRGVHQGILVRLRRRQEAGLASLITSEDRPSLALLLDRLTDPQNLGAVLRTAVGVGTDAVVLPKRQGALLTPGVHRASAGMSFVAPVASPQNLAAAIRTVKKTGYWVVAAAGDEATSATEFDWPSKTALVLGSEATGIRHELQKLSDFRVRLPLDPRVESLNVAVACGALVYLWRRQWPRNDTENGPAGGH